jgi:transposase
MSHWNTLRVQREYITEVLDGLPLEDCEKIFMGLRCRTKLQKVIKETVAKHNFVKASTLRMWVNHYVLWGETPIETSTREAKMGRLRKSRWTLRITELLREILQKHPELYLDEIQEELLLSSDCLFSTSTIYQRMKRMGFSLKKIYQKSSQRDEEERAIWRTFLLGRGPDVGDHLIFIDETHKSIKEMRRRRHWVPKGRGQPFCETPFYGNDRDIRYSMIGVADINGFVQEACEVIRTTGSGPDVGPINRERFELWVEQKLSPVLGNYALGEPRSLVVLDNATIHHSDRIVELIESRGAKIVYLPPYSPDLNPIELLFSLYKKNLEKFSIDHDWWTCHLMALDRIDPAAVRNNFIHCHVPVHDHPLLREDEEEEAAAVILLVLLLNQNNVN